MPDIRRRFDTFDRLEMPDLWTAAQRREPRPEPQLRAPRSRKAVVILTAFALTLAATGLVFEAFESGTNILPVTGVTKDWPVGAVPRLRLSFRYPSQWRLQPFDEEVGQVGFIGTLISNTDQTFHHAPDRDGVTTSWDMRSLPTTGVAISIEHIAGGPPGGPATPVDTPFPLDLANAKEVPHSTDPNLITPPPGASTERYLSFIHDGEYDVVRVFVGPDASPQLRQAVAHVVASIRPLDPTT